MEAKLLASGKCYVLWKGMYWYATSLYGYEVCIYGGSRGQIEILPGRPRDLWP